jgi:hypothetical protein
MAGIRGKKMPLPGELSIFTFRKGEVTGPPGGRSHSTHGNERELLKPYLRDLTKEEGLNIESCLDLAENRV